MTFGTKLQTLRKSKNMSQEALAEMLNVSRQAVSKWELDQALPDTANIIAISKIFNVTTDYLLLQEIVTPISDSSHKTKSFILLLAGILSATVGFLGNFTLYFVSRFIKVPMSVKMTTHYGEFMNTIYVRDFIKFINHFNLELIALFFLFLMITGISFIVYKYREILSSFLLKLYTKLKSLRLKRKPDTTE